MAGLLYYTDKRRMIPQLERVGIYKDTNALPYVDSLISLKGMRPLIILKDENLNQMLEDWRKSRDYNLAGDIISEAIGLNRLDDVSEVQHHLLSKYPANHVFRWLFKKGKLDLSTEQCIEYNHKKLAIEPDDAVTWTDQAINFIISNNRDEAIKSIESAISIDSSMGFVVRNAARVFNLVGDNARAIKLLKNSDYYRFDPQVLSAEIALSEIEKRKTNGIAIGDKLIKDNRYSSHEKSELASTLGTIEFHKENFKKSEQLFDLSLIDPNKNSFAQSLWYKRREISPQQFKSYADSNESQTHKYSKNNDFKNALTHSFLWMQEEPYSVRPYRVSSHITGVIFGDNDEAYDLIKKGSEAQRLMKGDNYSHQEELMSNNDMVYHLLKANRVQEAEAYLKPMLELRDSARKLESNDYVIIATLGLYAYKMKEIDLGKSLYRRAITHFTNSGEQYLTGSAFLNFFEEEIIASTSLSNLIKLREELDELIPNDTTKNELIIRKENSLRQFESAISKLK